MRWYREHDEVTGRLTVWDYAQVGAVAGGARPIDGYLYPWVRVTRRVDDWVAHVNYEDGSHTILFHKPDLSVVKHLVERWWETVHWHRFPAWEGNVYGTLSCCVRVYELDGDWFIQHEDKYDGVENLHHEKTLERAKRWTETWWKGYYNV